ncbi:DegT/DnrJ/EryC1/StrS family aminotransferase [Patulibacter sp. SYSU D01012]|uniref:DegT/DnrJ/EryC1/StrS family aminotransferase n=1 Tax=Patulibacter sp. SYSU D01012 TaxID=2817381 RepID=UPI001FEE72A2|nr:DegT/DnrJ/EryC1/StrS family aminotransferase [Patulibacter sp. SYSU D01012]
MAVPLFDPATALAPLRPQLHEALLRVADGGAFVLGPEVTAFEEEFAAWLGARHAVGVANGTEAITIALRALGVGPGDEVVVPSFTFWASAEAIPPTGATPVFCDVDPETMCVTPETVKAALTPRTKAVIAVHLFGNVAPVAEIRRETGLPVLEDAAQAAGSTLTADGDPTHPIARPGALGDVATFSFYPSKNLGAFGDGGAITTQDDAIAERVRTLRFHGSADKVDYVDIGYNSRLDELQAAVLRVLLPHVDDWAAHRAATHVRYHRAGLDELVAPPVAAPNATPAWHLYVVRSPRADELVAGLNARGIGARGYYRTPVHRQPPMARFLPGGGVDLPATDELARTHAAIPVSATITEEQVAEVVAAVGAVLA